MTQWTVYGLIDPRDHSVFYVGLSKVPSCRIGQHSSDRASPAYGVCQVIQSSGFHVGYCFFGKFTDKQEAKVLESRLILALPHVVNAKTSHGLASAALHPNWQDLRVSFDRRQAEKAGK